MKGHGEGEEEGEQHGIASCRYSFDFMVVLCLLVLIEHLKRDNMEIVGEEKDIIAMQHSENDGNEIRKHSKEREKNTENLSSDQIPSIYNGVEFHVSYFFSPRSNFLHLAIWGSGNNNNFPCAMFF